MPNWVKNKIIIDEHVSEEEFQELLRAVKTQRLSSQDHLPVPADWDTPYRCFDFNSLIPMPKGLDVESGTRSNKAQVVANIFDSWRPALADYISKCSSYCEIFRGASAKEVKQDYRAISLLLHPDVFEDKARATAVMTKINSWYQEALRAIPFCGTSAFFDTAYATPGRYSYTVNFLFDDMSRVGISPQSYDAIKKFTETEEGEKLLTFGKQLQENIKLYSAPTWYEWANANWGTKWNACEPEVDIDTRTITFDTAWTAPIGIATALTARFPQIDWKWLYAEEDRGNNAGSFVHEDCLLSVHKTEFGSTEACKISVEMWGESNCMYQDENGDWHMYDCGSSCPGYTECFGTEEEK